ncbi:hypothetical protein B0I32_106315 [Nonomuraea fuscirosea]|uniref:Uncharacterized protein n=1 Tax=Nonomuraea fuscirosea TaxID=1291556 RepID=A0A2T0N2L5_9ACTN|nr:DUF6349 family protein [Nonomuraea fuscirosea]PRX66179.1 hypothetical protein B0I32_106315 [Nonomuraea fuscirosea]
MSGESRGAAARHAARRQLPIGEGRGQWGIYFAHPGANVRGNDEFPSTAPDHRPTILFRVVDEPKWHQLYRGACLGCDWEGETRERERDAVEDAHDHAWPGWRDLPGVKPSKSNYERWLSDVKRAYPPGWLEAGGPIVTIRADSRFSRHSPGRAPGGGYDLAASYYQTKKTQRSAQEALDLEFHVGGAE